MSKHVMPLTYKPKIEAVKSGACCQTVRLLNKDEILPSDIRQRLKHPGDEVLIYTRVPPGGRYSKWDWRGHFVITEVLELCHLAGEWLWSPLGEYNDEDPHSEGDVVHRSELLDIVQRDHIDPPTIEEWERVLMSLNGLKTLDETDWEIIRWQSGVR